jgi:hypothetical protein
MPLCTFRQNSWRLHGPVLLQEPSEQLVSPGAEALSGPPHSGVYAAIPRISVGWPTSQDSATRVSRSWPMQIQILDLFSLKAGRITSFRDGIAGESRQLFLFRAHCGG